MNGICICICSSKLHLSLKSILAAGTSTTASLLATTTVLLPVLLVDCRQSTGSGSGLYWYSGGLTWSIGVLRCDDHTGIFMCDGCARDSYFYVPAETQSYVTMSHSQPMSGYVIKYFDFLAQGKSLPPAGIELRTFGLQWPWDSHVSHCTSKTHILILPLNHK